MKPEDLIPGKLYRIYNTIASSIRTGMFIKYRVNDPPSWDRVANRFYWLYFLVCDKIEVLMINDQETRYIFGLIERKKTVIPSSKMIN